MTLKVSKVFSYYLADGLQGIGDRNGDGYIEADELFTYVADSVRTWAKQHGYQQTPRKQDNVTGSILIGYHPENRRRDNTISLKLNSTRIDRNCEQSQK